MNRGITSTVSGAASHLLAFCEAPFGYLQIWGTAERMQSLRIHAQPFSPGQSGACPALVFETLKALDAYLIDPDAALPLPPLEAGTPYQQRVWAAIRAIPVGETRRYGDLADQLGSHPRPIARACGLNPFPLLTPCHRVVASHGLGGFMQGVQPAALSIKRWLLAHEAR